MRKIEEFVFWTNENNSLYYAKEALMNQIDRLDIAIRAKGFFSIHRAFLAAVCFSIGNFQIE